MPDWSYQPLFRPLLFRLPPATARDLTLGAIGRLAELPLGSAVIRFMGHMEPPATLKRTVFGLAFPGPVGLGAGLDAHAVALPALAQFGFGFLEVGPVTVEPVRSARQIERRGRQAAIWYPAAPVNDGLEALAGRLARAGSLPVPVGVRLAHRPGADAEAATVERRRLIARLAPYADFFALDTRWGADGWSAAEWAAHLTAMRDAARDGASARPLLICLAPDLAMAAVERLLAPAVALGVAGVMVGGGVAEGDGRLVGAPAREPALRLTRALRERWGDQLAIVAAGGVQQPADALRLLRAGATLVQVHSGLVYAGPGLPKRINEAVAYAEAARVGASDVVARPDAPAERVPGWLWLTLLGAGMILGGVLAWQVAATRVVLPYDETFVGLSRAELLAVNARLLAFMAHDRVTLAGTMISIGVLYAMLALHGVRRAMHWAWKAIAVSGAVGFASFFLAFGFGYFDPLHALVTVALLPFFLFGLRGRPRGLGEQPSPNLRNDARWRVGLWGQLLFVALGVGLTLSGAIIAAVGVTTVFVPEDLGFLGATAAELQAANPRLLPLIAHDRAGFGGALASNGLAVLLPALWGFRQGARWLWWALLAAGAPGFAAALGVHAAVGYLDAWHLAPAATAALLYLAALILSYPYLCARPAFGR